MMGRPSYVVGCRYSSRPRPRRPATIWERLVLLWFFGWFIVFPAWIIGGALLRTVTS